MSLLGSAQSKQYTYTYDDNGNRIARNVVYLSTTNGANGSTAATAGVYEENGSQLPSNVIAVSGELTIDLFPNPTAHAVNIEYGKESVTTEEVRILNGDGKVVYQVNGVKGNFTLPFHNLPAGRYFIWLKVNGKIERFPVIKRL